MKTRELIILILSIIQLRIYAQQKIPMQQNHGVYSVPCEVNGLKLDFIFDTGATDVHLSLLEAAFMLKNGYISEDDFLGTKSYSMADGSISENAIVNLKDIKIGDLHIKNVKACISSKIEASLLLGQSALQKMGKYTIDGNYLILHDSKSRNDGSTNEYDNSKEVYIGDYKDGLRHGKGICKYPSGDVYDGQWTNGKYNGYGTYTWSTGDKYVGYFKDGFRSGRGTYTWLNGEKYVGQWVNGKRNGQGTDYYVTGDKYVGNWVDSKRDGYGVMYYSDGRKYSGKWRNGVIDGQGVYTWPNGDKYEGAYVNGYREGKGTYIWASGSKYVGFWKGGKRNGYGTYTDSNGKEERGIWIDDEMPKKGEGDNEKLKSEGSSDKYYKKNQLFLAKTKYNIELRESPSLDSELIANIPQGHSVLAILESEEKYIKILSYNEDLYGYTNKSALTDFKEVKVSKDLKAIGKASKNTISEIEIENQSNIQTTVNIGASIYKFIPHEKRVIALEPGFCYIIVSALGANPYIMSADFDAGKKYFTTLSLNYE